MTDAPLTPNPIEPDPSSGPAPTSAPSRRRTAVVAGVTVGTLAVLAAGGYAAMSFLGGSDGAETAMPASVLAEVSIDLDPGAKQKIEAIKTLRKFPEFRKEAKIDSGADLRKKFFEEALKDSDCRGKVTYAADIEPWIGESAAVGAFPVGAGKVSPLVALAVSDEDKARRGLTALLDCSGDKDDAGFAFSDGFVLIADTTAHAEKAVADAGDSSLADDASYQTWSKRAGDRGVVNFYVAKAAASYAAKNADALPGLGGSATRPTSRRTSRPSC